MVTMLRWFSAATFCLLFASDARAICFLGGCTDIATPGTIPDVPLVMTLPDRKSVTLTEDWRVGDCVLKAGAYIQFHRNGSVGFIAQGYSSDTGDVWHQFFEVRTAYGQLVYQNTDQFRVPASGDLPACGDGACAIWAEEFQWYDPTLFDALSFITLKARC